MLTKKEIANIVRDTIREAKKGDKLPDTIADNIIDAVNKQWETKKIKALEEQIKDLQWDYSNAKTPQIKNIIQKDV